MVDKLVSGVFKRFFESENMDPGLLDKLKVSLNTAYGVLDDAESKQITDDAVETWLGDLRDATYQADDLLDLIEYAATAAEIEADKRAAAADQPRSVFSSLNPFKKARVEHSSTDIPKKMEEIAGKLDVLLQQTVTLGLRVGDRKDAFPPRQPTTSLVEESEIVGREKEKEAIFQLLQENGADGRKNGVIPIVGMGGIGKTTLAQVVYNDSRTKRLFKCRAWVCVSENYDGLKIKREVLKQVKSSARCDDLTPEQVDTELKKSLNGKKFLLILDDMWNDNYGDWDELKKPLESGAVGSKIIITTRSEIVASTMRTIQRSHHLDRLDEDCCWQLFVKHAFNGEIVKSQRLEAIGKEIVGKCGGLPLAAKMLGGLLRDKRKVEDWEEILNNNMWDLPNDNVLPALRLSYQHLPSYLKQCFAYCAIYPKDFRMKKEEIIPLWMAEGFLEQPGRRNMEELGEKCFHELVSRSFLQEYNDKYGSCFLMHDLINDLAKLVSREFLIRIDGENSHDFNERNRYFSFTKSKANSSKKLLHASTSKAQFLRSLLPLDVPSDWLVDDAVVNDLVSHLRCLRVLALSDFREVEILPETIGNLKHLRYLNLESTGVKRLPESVCTLYNLQTLILYKCYNLVRLPKEIGSLINLRFLDIIETPNLRETPPRMGNLKDLRTLCKFVVAKQNGSDINELGMLQHLRGELHIYNIKDVVDTSNDILKNKIHLENLTLQWSDGIEHSQHGTSVVDSVHERRVLERLQPDKNIKRLSIHDFGGIRFADWVGDVSYTNIVSLELHNCKYCTTLPPLEQLSSLQHLSILGCDAVVKVSMKMPFRSLKALRIHAMSKWEEWIFCEENHSGECGSLAKLKELYIWDCPELKSISICGLSNEIFQSLDKLEVMGCPKLKTSKLIAVSNFKQLPIRSNIPDPSDYLDDRNIYFLCGVSQVKVQLISSATYAVVINYPTEEEIEKMGINYPTEEGIEEMGIPFNALEDIIVGSSNFCKCIPLGRFPKLKSLYVTRCLNLRSLAESEEPLHHPLTSLATLELNECHSLVYFPRGGIPAPNLTHLELIMCSNLVSLPEGMHVLLPSLKHLVIYDCDEIESFPEGGLPADLQSLEIAGCKKLIRGRQQWALPTLHALSKLRLGSYDGDDLESFPEDTMLPSTLTSLEMSGSLNLKVINYNGLQHLISLVQLDINDCHNLQSLPEQGLPSSLSVLKIEDCPELESLGGLSANLQSLDIKGCDKLIGGRMQWGLQRLNALSKLRLRYYYGDDLDSFPEKALFPSTLRSLEIDWFENLKAINFNGLKDLNSLAELKFSDCSRLQCLPKEGLPPSLSTLVIGGCLSLEERCKKGEDRSKISGISNVYFL